MEAAELSRLANMRIAEVIRYARNDPEERETFGGLRTLLDEWAAFVGGGKLLRRGRQGPTQRWFNRPCPVEEAPILLEKIDWVSTAAEQIVAEAALNPSVYSKRSDTEGRFSLTLDHSVPIATIRAIISDNPRLWTLPNMREFLCRNLRRGLITVGEHKALKDARLAERMPWGWDDGDSPFLRYTRAKIAGRELR
jgi:hypothetical protein